MYIYIYIYIYIATYTHTHTQNTCNALMQQFNKHQLPIQLNKTFKCNLLLV